MFSSTEPVSSSAFTDAGMTIYNYSNGNWQLNPQYFRRMGSYIVKNPNNAVTITVNGSLHILNGVYNGQIVYKGWNTLANNSDSAKLLSEMNFRTYLNVPECTQPLCGDYKSMAQLLSDNRIYSRIYLFNDLTSADPNVFYATKILSSADLNNYKIPAHAGFWMYLFQ